MAVPSFHPITQAWFVERFGEPTEPQALGWPEIASKKNTLIAAPTGSGKTLAAFLVCIDRLLRHWLDGTLADQTSVVYVSPLKALGNDIERNLQTPLEEIQQRCISEGGAAPQIRTAVRTGDTPASQRQSMLRRPPHILVTTPESLYLLLTSVKGREVLSPVETVIVDEIHALARDKRGSHLALSLARLDVLCQRPPVRIGLSATQRPIDEIARFLVGTGNVDESGSARCAIVDVGHARELDVAVEVPPSELGAVCSHEQWDENYSRLTELIHQRRSTLIFVNTRRLAERIAHYLTETLGAEAVASHHGSLSRELRQSAERRLKAGTLKAIVATASLEMGIDVGFIDLVCQIGSPRSIATFLQRVGRSGHSLGAVPCGRLFPLTRDELIECLALVRAVRRGDLDQIEPPIAPLDIAAQQIVAAVACEDWDEDKLFELCRTAWPYRDLRREDFDAVVKTLSEGIAPGVHRGRHLHRDAIHGRLRARRGARLTALTSGGAIPETAQYRVVAEPDKKFVGQLDEDFAIESQAGDVFLLGNTSWQIRHIRGGEVTVRDAQGAPPNVPFWFGEAPGRTVELSAAISQMRADLAGEQLGDAEAAGDEQDSLAPQGRSQSSHARQSVGNAQPPHALASVATELAYDARDSIDCSAEEVTTDWLVSQCGTTEWAAEQAVHYVAAQKAAIGMVPTQQRIVFERFFDESGGMQLVIHSPLGARINRAWGLALRKRFCRSFDFELQASATDDGIVLSIGPQHSFPIENLFRMLTSRNGRDLLEQAVLAAPMFQVRWRWNVTRALAVLRQRGGSKVPPHLQRFQADDLLAAVFPQTVGCLENHQGDVEVPDHPFVGQTMHDCLHEAMDVDRWLGILDDIQAGRVELVPRETREPSPFSHELLNANPYAFLDDAALEERRTRAVTLRRSLPLDELSDLGRLDPEAIAQVTRDAAPVVRTADELHDALLGAIAITEGEGQSWSSWMNELAVNGRATRVLRKNATTLWAAAENWPLVSAIWKDAAASPPVTLPPSLDVTWETAKAAVELVRGRVALAGPVTATELAHVFDLRPSQVGAALEALEGEGIVLRGRFRQPRQETDGGELEIEWCDRRLLARIHRLTLDGLRRQIQPVTMEAFVRFLARRHHLLPDDQWGGAVGVSEAVHALQGFELPAGAWEADVLSARVDQYDPDWLDQLFAAGETTWGRLSSPRRNVDNGRNLTALTRSVPISLQLREDLGWLLPTDRPPTQYPLSTYARTVQEALVEHGALFTQDLKAVTGLLDAHLDEALCQLAALGMVTSDTFDAVRRITSAGNRARRSRRSDSGTRVSASGRWSRFPGPVKLSSPEEHVQRWCRQLLRRWGIVFRDLLARESVAPPWRVLVSTFRNMERRGLIRGGRFVAQVGGEQFGEPSAVDSLRSAADVGQSEPWIAVSAVDPLNLVGTISSGQCRIPAIHTNSLIFWHGRCIAARQSGEITFYETVDPTTNAEMNRALLQSRRPKESRLFSPAGQR